MDKTSIDYSKWNSYKLVKNVAPSNIIFKILMVLIVIVIAIMFFPWTQNISGKGYLTALRPDQRPQTIQSVIAGRIEKWYVNEGQLVEKGDTILYISEIKSDYMDPQLLNRTQNQINSKESAVSSYMSKVKALDKQIDALIENRALKIEQAKNKIIQSTLDVKSDSINLVAAQTNRDIAKTQLDRNQNLFDQGLKSRKELEEAKIKMQQTDSKLIESENKLLASRNKLINAQIAINTIETDFNDKISKSESNKFEALSGMYDAEATVTKLQTQFMNYSVRSGYYYITAPTKGYVTKALKTGIGENIKDGDEIITIVPDDPNLAIEMYVRPVDLPLIHKNANARIIFDGWPAIVFSGWPGTSFGTFGGKVYAVDNFTNNKDGLFRVLIVPDEDSDAWPELVKVGSGAKLFLLLDDVPIWFEIWRNINGFPPNFYSKEDVKEK